MTSIFRFIIFSAIYLSKVVIRKAAANVMRVRTSTYFFSFKYFINQSEKSIYGAEHKLCRMQGHAKAGGLGVSLFAETIGSFLNCR